MMKLPIACAALVGILSMPIASQAQVVFQDDFNSENGGSGAVNYAGFAKWTVSDGFVDLIGTGFFDIYPGNGLYVDMDGSGSNAGIMTSDPIAVLPGTYTLEFDLGIHTGFGESPMTVSFGSEYSEMFVEADAGLSPTFNSIVRTFQVGAPANLSIVFDHQGGDDFGLVIDNVRLSVVPEPSSFAMALLALGWTIPAARSRRNGRLARTMRETVSGTSADIGRPKMVQVPRLH